MGMTGLTFLLCQDTEGFASTAGDCDDFNDQVYPGANYVTRLTMIAMKY